LKITKLDSQPVFADENIVALYARLKELTQFDLDASGTLWNWPLAGAITAPTLGRLLYFADLYRKVLDVPGEIFEFGTHFGAGASTLINLRSLFEPRNQSRILRVFDTFAGFSGVKNCDGDLVSDGDFMVPDGYQENLEAKLRIHESVSNWSRPSPGFSVHPGDVRETLPDFLGKNSATVISMAIFDMDIYVPTLEGLQTVLPFMSRGGLLVFDEFGSTSFPGETLAVREVIEPLGWRIYRHPLVPYCAWATVGGEM
jgi:hypothetical protein